MPMGNFNISAGMLSAARQNRTRGREEGIVSMEMTNNGNSAEDNVAAAEEAREMGINGEGKRMAAIIGRRGEEE